MISKDKVCQTLKHYLNAEETILNSDRNICILQRGKRQFCISSVDVFSLL